MESGSGLGKGDDDVDGACRAQKIVTDDGSENEWDEEVLVGQSGWRAPVNWGATEMLDASSTMKVIFRSFSFLGSREGRDEEDDDGTKGTCVNRELLQDSTACVGEAGEIGMKDGFRGIDGGRVQSSEERINTTAGRCRDAR